MQEGLAPAPFCRLRADGSGTPPEPKNRITGHTCGSKPEVAIHHLDVRFTLES